LGGGRLQGEKSQTPPQEASARLATHFVVCAGINGRVEIDAAAEIFFLQQCTTSLLGPAEERVIRQLGGAVIVHWTSLPKEVRSLFRRRSCMIA
jgi:hypothetical protein